MASCPNCGFDLAPDGGCPVCGYGRAGGKRQGSAAKRTRTMRVAAPRTKSLALIGGTAAAVIVVVVAVILIAGHSKGSASSAPAVASQSPPTASSNAATSPAPAAQPSAAPATEKAAPATAAVDTITSGANPQPPAAATSYDPAKFDKSPYFSVAVGASPLAVRAVKPIDLYDPAHQPVYNIDNMPYPPLTSEDAYVAWMHKHYPGESEYYVRWRWQRAEIALERHRITHQRVLEAFLLTPREWFVRSFNLKQTYANTAIPIGWGQTISGPDLVSNMTNALDPQPNQRVLEIGTGSGYQSAFLSSLSNYVYTIEIVRPLAEQTNEIYLQHTPELPQLANIHRRAADGYYGWPRYAPFDRIIVTTGIDHIPPILLQELKPGGIMVIPVGPPTGQVVLKITKSVGPDGNIHITREDIYHGTRKEIFVPFTAASGGTHNIGNTAN